MAIPTIPVYTGGVANPDGSQDQQEFTTNMFNQLSYEAALAPSLNDTVNEMNTVAGQVDTNAAIAQSSADAAQASANFEGEFVVGVTSAEKGKSYSYNSEVWLCLQNTTTTPSQGAAEWKLSVGEQYVTTAQGDVLGGKLFKGSNGETVEIGDQIPVGTTHLGISVGGNDFIVKAWDNLTLPAIVTTMPTSGNGFNGYDVVTDQGTFEFVTESVCNSRKSGHVEGWGVIDSSSTASTANLIRAIEDTPINGGLSFYGMGAVTLDSHVITYRGDITIDFHGCDIYWKAPTGYEPDRTGNIVSNPRSPGIFCFRGELTGEEYTETLTSELPEFSEQYPVPGVSSAFTRGSWWVVTSDIAPGATVGREINYLIESQGDFGNPNEVRLNYRSGWTLAAGRTLTYKKANPVKNIKMLNMGRFFYQQEITDSSGTGTDWTSQQATSFVSFEIAADYELIGLEAFDPPYTVVWEQWVSNGKEVGCQTNNPTIRRSDQIVGRNGALYCVAEDLFNKSGSNVLDHTSSAYCVVRNSRETGTKNGAYTHHGSFEHDITFENTGGVLSIANSGPDYGESAKRINAKNHNGTQLIADKKVSDCTFESCTFSEFAKVNCDNNNFVNTNVPKSDPSLLGGLMFYQSSQRTGKGFSATGGIIELSISVDAIPSSILEDVSFNGTKLTDFRARVLNGFGLLSFINVEAESTLRGANQLGQAKTVICGGVWKSVPFRLTGAKDQYIALDGGYKAEGAGDVTNNITWDFDKDSGGILEINIGDASFNDLGNGTKHFKLSAATGDLKYKSVGASYTGGKIEFQPSTSNIQYLYHKANVESGVTRESVPTEGANISTLDNMIV